MTESLSIEQARKLALLSQRLPPTKQTGSATAATLSAIEHLGYIQIDTISVVQRAHHHTLWNRNPRYKLNHLDQLLNEQHIFEYWSHAAAYLPLRDFRFTLPRKQALASGKQKHWYARDEKMIQAVLQRITAEGPLMAKDFEHSGKKMGEWQTKPAKRALEYLFMQGDLMIPQRKSFHKVYDLTERVLPANTNLTPPTSGEYADFLILSYLRANGLGQAAEMAYLIKNAKPLVTRRLKYMVENAEILPIEVAGNKYYTLPTALTLLNKPLSRGKLKILSPFDNLVIQRQRIQALFGFDYLIECYLPQAKRQYGYFSLPILWDGKLIARMDCRAHRDDGVLHILHLALETNTSKIDALFLALSKELNAFLTFNACQTIKVHRVTPAKYQSKLQATLHSITL